MDNITRLEDHVTKAKGVLSDVTGLLSEVFEQLHPHEPLPPTLPEIVQRLTPISTLLDEFTLAKTKAGARAAITFATASGIDGDFEKAYADFPRQPDGKKCSMLKRLDAPFQECGINGSPGELSPLLLH